MDMFITKLEWGMRRGLVGGAMGHGEMQEMVSVLVNTGEIYQARKTLGYEW